MNNPEPSVSTIDSQAAHAPPAPPALSGRSRAHTNHHEFPTLLTDLTPDEVIARLRKRSQQGKLPGFEHRGGHIFRVLCFGTPYDKELIGSVAPTEDAVRGARVRFHTRLLRKLPAVMIITLILTIWPGVWITHSLLVTYFGWYPKAYWITCAWYIPLCVIAIPALLKQYKRSMAAADEHAQEITHAIANVLDAKPAE